MLLYLDGGTFVHRLNPIVKILGLLFLFTIPLYFSDPTELLPIMLLFVVIAALSKSLPNLRKMLGFMVILAIFTTVLWSLFRKEGDPFFKIGFLSASPDSVLYGLGMGIRLDSMLISGLVFLSSTRVEEFTAGLRKLGVPFAVSFALSLAFRLVPLFFSTTATVIEAQKSRGLDLESGNIFARLRKYVPLLVPIFVYAIRDTDMLSMALESKGFHPKRERTYYLEPVMRWADWMTLFLLALTNLFFLWIALR